MPRSQAYRWKFKLRFRRNAFGWRAQPAIKRIKEAVREITKVAKKDPALGAEGGVIFLEKLSPALTHVDSSSGAIGSAVNNAIDALVLIIAAADEPPQQRQQWLERLWEAICADDIPYLETLAEHWGTLCATPEIASKWADELLDLTRPTLSDRTPGAYFRGTIPCLSALFAAKRFNELHTLLKGQDFWHYKVWAIKALAAEGQKSEAIAIAEASRGPWTPDHAVDFLCESILLSSGLYEEAYNRYGLNANRVNTFLGWYRAVCKRYSTIPQVQILRDLIQHTPGEEGKWFATAKETGHFELAIALARRSPTDPKTLTRAARDFATTNPEFALEAGISAINWLARGYGYEITDLDILNTYSHTLSAARYAGLEQQTDERIQSLLSNHEPRSRYIAEILTKNRGTNR